MRILAFDAGEKRIGVAVSDETRIIAAPVGFIENNDSLESELNKLIDENKPSEIVIGNPLNMDGSKSRNNAYAEKLAEKIGVLHGEVRIVMWDERLTTVQAQRALIKGNVKRKKRKTLVDKVAAVIILQSYLDYLKNKKSG